MYVVFTTGVIAGRIIAARAVLNRLPIFRAWQGMAWHRLSPTLQFTAR